MKWTKNLIFLKTTIFISNIVVFIFLKINKKVKGTMFNSGQFQVIFGTGTVNKVYEAIQGLGGVSESSVSDMKKEAAKQGNVIQRISRTFGDIFVPIIPVLVATVLFMGLCGLLTNENLLKLMGTTPESINPNFLMYTQVLTDTAFIIFYQH